MVTNNGTGRPRAARSRVAQEETSQVPARLLLLVGHQDGALRQSIAVRPRGGPTQKQHAHFCQLRIALRDTAGAMSRRQLACTRALHTCSRAFVPRTRAEMRRRCGGTRTSNRDAEALPRLSGGAHRDASLVYRAHSSSVSSRWGCCLTYSGA